MAGGTERTIACPKNPESLIDRSILKAKNISRKVALLIVRRKTQEDHQIFALQFDPRMPTVQPMPIKHYRSMISQDSYLK